ncbi:MAG: hypothetical protein LBQ00_00600 [Syntrophobacterales bacterium]|nr:hypothetical protein [Syntrophobacterales bacterium]
MQGKSAIARGARETGAMVVVLYPETPGEILKAIADNYQEIYAKWAKRCP